MIAIEIEAPIVDHRINITSDQFPAQLRLAKVIVMFNEDDLDASTQSVLASLRAKPAQVRGDGMPMKREELYDRTGPRS